MTSPDVTWPRRTERLLLRPYAETDAERLVQIRNRPDVAPFRARLTGYYQRFFVG